MHSKKVQELAPEAKGTVSFTDTHLLAKLTNSSEKCSGFRFKFGNYIKSGSFNTCLFKELCRDMFSTHEVHLFRTSVRWLLKGNVPNNVCEMMDERKLFSELKANEFLSYFSDEICLKCLDYLAEMLEKLNNTNLKVQGKVTNIIQFRDESASNSFEVAKLAS